METWVIILPTSSIAKTDRREVRKFHKSGQKWGCGRRPHPLKKHDIIFEKIWDTQILKDYFMII